MRITIKLKLLVTFAVIITLSTATAVLGITSLGALDSSLHAMVQGPVQRLELAQGLYIDMLSMVRGEKNMVLAKEPAEVETYAGNIAQARRDFLSHLDAGEAIASVEGKPKWAAIRAIWQPLATADDKLQEAARRGDLERAVALSVGDLRKLMAEVQKNALEMVGLTHKQMAQTEADVAAQYSSARLLLLSAVGLSLLIAIGSGAWMAIGLSRGLRRAGVLAQGVAGGDLTQTLDNVSRDEVGDLVGHINAMVMRLREVVSDAASASEQVSSGSQELSATAEQLSEGGHGASLVGRRGVGLDGADVLEHQAECR